MRHRLCLLRPATRWRPTAAAWLALAMLAGCGGGEDRSKAQIRLVNASIDHAALDLYDDQGRRLRAGVAFGGDAAYAEVDPADADLDLRRAGSPTPLTSTAPALAEGKRYSLVAYAAGGTLATALVDDNASAADSGRARLRVLNAAPDAGALDVYLTTAGAELADAEPLHANTPAGGSSALATVDATGWRLRVTKAGDPSDLRLDLPALTLASREVATLVLTPGAGGVLVDALVLVQRGTISRHAGSAARVRVLAGVTDSGAVSASVGGVSLMNGTGAPAAGSYRRVPAGAAAGSASVDGEPLALPPMALEGGRDYTLLVWGDAAAARAGWIADDNRLPAVAGQAKLRLVHGLADVADPLAMTLDYSPVADGVAPGSSSTATRVDAVSAGALAVTAPGRGHPLWQAGEQMLAAGGVYTLFVVGRETGVTGILRKDR